MPYATAASRMPLVAYRSRLRRLTLKLCLAHDIAPTLLILRSVQCTDQDQLGAGGFADVYMGTYIGQRVALKRLRAHQMMSDDEKQKLKKVGILYRLRPLSVPDSPHTS